MKTSVKTSRSAVRERTIFKDFSPQPLILLIFFAEKASIMCSVRFLFRLKTITISDRERKIKIQFENRTSKSMKCKIIFLSLFFLAVGISGEADDCEQNVSNKIQNVANLFLEKLRMMFLLAISMTLIDKSEICFAIKLRDVLCVVERIKKR